MCPGHSEQAPISGREEGEFHYLEKRMKKHRIRGIGLEFKKNKVVFGYIRRKNDETDELMEELLGFLREKLKLEKRE